MLTWNNHDTFKRCITSMTPLILDERVEEMIILDNGSHEIAMQKLLRSTEKNYNKIRVIYSSDNLGIAKGRKYLYDLCKGDYILSFDSDIVIVNAPQFIEMFLRAINLDDMWLVGGGGGNHTFFPTIFRTDINNLPSPKESSQVTLVDEVAGWFHGFKTSRLKKNGGTLYMDEQFTPFWGEDSDFCYQIKLQGGKCCILGQGSLGHAWSSCDKIENHTNIAVMWKKMTDKWYPKFGKVYQIDLDEKFYVNNYNIKEDVIDVKEKYLLEGMRYGHVINKKHISDLFPVEFLSDTKLTYKKKEYHTRDFVDKFFNRDNIVSNNYNVVIDNLKESENAFFININKEEELGYITSELIKVRNSAVIVVTLKGISHKVEKILSKHFTNYYLAEFTNYFDNTIPFIISLQETINHTFNNVIKLSTQTEITNTMNFEKTKDNAFAIDLIMDYFHYKPMDYYNYKGMVMNHEQLKNIVKSYPLKRLLDIALRLPTEYSYNISPRFCPRLALDKLLTQMENYDFEEEKSLVIYLSSIDDSEVVLNNTKKLKESGDCDIVILNYGIEKFWKVDELGFDYYFIIPEQEFLFYNFFSIFNILHLLDYSNVIMMKDGFVIEEPLKEFFDHAYYHNVSFMKNKDDFPFNLLSVKADILNQFAGMVQQIQKMSEEKKEENKDDINVMKTIDINAQRNFGLRYLWQEEREENNDEISIEYSKINDKFNPDEDFPILFEE